MITLSRVKITGNYWSSIKDTLTHGEQRITLSSNKITTDYCLTLEEDRLVNWGKNSSQLEYQCSQPSKLKVATSPQSAIISRRFDRKRVRKKYNFKFKVEKPKKCSKSQVFELRLRLGVHKTNRKLSEIHNWRFRKRRISGWLYDILFGMLIAGVYSMQHMIAPTLEDIKNKLRSSAGIGGYGMDLKISSKEFKEFWDPSKKGVQLIEMGYVLISKSSTKLAGIEVVALRNLNTANRMYAGNIHCEPDQYSCQEIHWYASIPFSFGYLRHIPSNHTRGV